MTPPVQFLFFRFSICGDWSFRLHCEKYLPELGSMRRLSNVAFPNTLFGTKDFKELPFSKMFASWRPATPL